MLRFSFVKRIPFLGIFIAYLIGVLLHEFYSFEVHSTILLTLISTLLVIFSLFRKRDSLILALMYALCLISGYSLVAFRENRIELLGEFYFNRELEMDGKVLEVDSLKNYDKCIILLNKYDRLRKIKALAFFEREKSNGICLQPGQSIFFKGEPGPLTSLQNPDAFDYSRYLKNNGILFQVFVPEEKWCLGSNQKAQTLLATRAKYLSILKKTLSENLKRNTQVALIQAITLGQKEELSEETLSAFSNTGARHILAVSGMHVGIMMLLIQFILRLIPGSNIWFTRSRLVITLCGIWMYAWITGLAPPVTRASFMFTLFLIGRLGNKDYQSLNALFLSAFVLLLLNPALIYDLGFQFSYTALLSIILFYPLLSKMVKPSSKVLNYITQIILLTLSVQPLILPLSIYYFHKIPLFFLISSLLVTPLAFVLMLLTLLFFVDYFTVHFFYHSLSILLGKVADLFNRSIIHLDRLSFGTIENVCISPFSLLILFIIGAILFYLLKRPQKPILISLLLSLNLFFLSLTNPFKDKAVELCIYADYKMALLDVFIDHQCYSWNSGQFNECESTFVNREHRIRKRVRQNIPLVEIDSDFFTVKIGGISIGVFQSAAPNIYDCRIIDILLIHTNDKETLDELFQHIDASHVILTSAVKYNTRNWLSQAYDFEIWDLQKKGAFVLEIDRL